VEEERVRGGEVAVERIDRIDHKIAQVGYHNRHKNKADRAPADDELAVRRERFEAR
jgi:hypothetical protein